jgi:hypothetical protein
MSIPKNYKSSESFEVYFLMHIYSEAGHVGTVDIKATCK